MNEWTINWSDLKNNEATTRTFPTASRSIAHRHWVAVVRRTLPCRRESCTLPSPSKRCPCYAGRPRNRCKPDPPANGRTRAPACCHEIPLLTYLLNFTVATFADFSGKKITHLFRAVFDIKICTAGNKLNFWTQLNFLTVTLNPPSPPPRGPNG